MKYFTVIVFSVCLFNKASAIDEHDIGDTLYVWAQSGLNLRETLDLNGKIITTLKPGERLTVLKITDKKLSLDSGIDTTTEVKDPYLLKGNWIWVKSENSEGYVFDVFLLPFPAPKTDEYFIENYLLSILEFESSSDSIWSSQWTFDATYKTSKGISSYCHHGETTFFRSMEFEGFTIEDVFVFFSYFIPDLHGKGSKDVSPPELAKNWLEELKINYDQCHLVFRKKEDTILVDDWCSY